MNAPFLEVKDFAQIREARIELGDLTVLVGAQATGKSLLLQLLKLVLDGPSIMFLRSAPFCSLMVGHSDSSG